MNESSAAYRVGYIAGYGLGAVGTGNGPHGNTHTAWTNYVPAWVDEAKQNTTWRDGWNVGLSAGIRARTTDVHYH